MGSEELLERATDAAAGVAAIFEDQHYLPGQTPNAEPALAAAHARAQTFALVSIAASLDRIAAALGDVCYGDFGLQVRKLG